MLYSMDDWRTDLWSKRILYLTDKFHRFRPKLALDMNIDFIPSILVFLNHNDIFITFRFSLLLDKELLNLDVFSQ